MQTIEETASNLHNALFTSKTKEQDIISIILQNDSNRRQAIKKYYTAVFNEKGLADDLKNKLSSYFKDLVTHLFSSPVEYDCFQLQRAFKGMSVDEECVYEIITNRPFWMINEIKIKYTEMFQKDLQKEIEKKCSGHIGRNLLILMNTERRTTKHPDNKKCENDAKTLYSVTKEEMWGTNEDIFKNIFAKSSPEELVLTMRYYFKKTGANFIKECDAKLSSKMKVFFRELIYNVINPAEIMAEKVKKAVKGLGTDTNLLERIIISRHEVDMEAIREYYKDKFKVSIQEDIIDDTSGNYQKLLVALSEK